jgi:hypothetical protein
MKNQILRLSLIHAVFMENCHLTITKYDSDINFLWLKVKNILQRL